MTKTHKSIRIDQEVLDWLVDYYGLTGTFGAEAKAIDLALRFNKNVLRMFFGSDLKAIFKRNPKDISKAKY